MIKTDAEKLADLLEHSVLTFNDVKEFIEKECYMKDTPVDRFEMTDSKVYIEWDQDKYNVVLDHLDNKTGYLTLKIEAKDGK